MKLDSKCHLIWHLELSHELRLRGIRCLFSQNGCQKQISIAQGTFLIWIKIQHQYRWNILMLYMLKSDAALFRVRIFIRKNIKEITSCWNLYDVRLIFIFFSSQFIESIIVVFCFNKRNILSFYSNDDKDLWCVCFCKMWFEVFRCQTHQLAHLTFWKK